LLGCVRALHFGSAAALLEKMLFPIFHAAIRAVEFPSAQNQLAMAALEIGRAVEALARSAKSAASLACHARALSLMERWAAMRSSTARRR
jgi:hypothetical protein